MDTHKLLVQYWVSVFFLFICRNSFEGQFGGIYYIFLMYKNKNDLAKSGYIAFACLHPFLRGNTAQDTCSLDEMVNHRALASSPRPSLGGRPEAA